MGFWLQKDLNKNETFHSSQSSIFGFKIPIYFTRKLVSCGPYGSRPQFEIRCSRAVVPNRGSSDPWGCETPFPGVRNAIFEGERFLWYCWMYVSSK